MQSLWSNNTKTACLIPVQQDKSYSLAHRQKSFCSCDLIAGLCTYSYSRIPTASWLQPGSDAPSLSPNHLMASSLRASTHCSPACFRTRNRLRCVAPAGVGGSKLHIVDALISNKPTLPSTTHQKDLARHSKPFRMSRRTWTVVAKVSQTKSKSNSKQEGQPPEDNVYIAVTLGSHGRFSTMCTRHASMMDRCFHPDTHLSVQCLIRPPA